MTRRSRTLVSSAGFLVLIVASVVGPGCKKIAARDASAPMESAKMADGAGSDGDSASGPTTWQRSTLDTHRIQIEVGDDETLPIDALHVQVRVDGFRARVLLDVDFHSPHDQALEGELQLRLPEGASPYFLAFGPHAIEAAPVAPVDLEDPATSFSPEGIMAARQSLWTGPKQAVMVERDQAKLAYRATVAQQVDPAISEWAGAGVFNTRLFPITGNQLHRVVIGYDVDLVASADGWRLPLMIPNDAAHRDLDLDVAALPGVNIELAVAGQAPVPPSSSNAERLRYQLQEPPQVVELALRGSNAVGLMGNDPATGSYFAARVTPQLPEIQARAGVRRAVFAVDVSLSSNPEKFNVWLDLLEAMLVQNRDEIGEFAVLFFNVEQFWWSPSFVANRPDQVEALLTYANTLALEGATDLDAALSEAAQPDWLAAQANAGVGAGDWDLFLLSDGAATWGEPDRERSIREVDEQLEGRVFAYRTGLPGTELSLLSQLARETGGAVFSVTGPDEVANAATAHRNLPWELLEVTLRNPGSARNESAVGDLLVEGDPRFIYPGQALTIAGRLDTNVASAELAPRAVQLRVRSLSGVEQTLEVALPAVLATPLAPRIYGQIAVTALERYHALAGEQIDTLAYSRHFRINGPVASLLMLESETDYQSAGLDLEAIAVVDSSKVAAAPVTQQLQAVERGLGQLLGDPRATLIASLHRIEAVAPAEHYAELRALVERLPASAFDVDIPALACARHDRDAIPDSVLAQLFVREPDYDTFVAEAERRRTAVGAADALKLLSTLVEANPGDTTMARDVAFTAREWGLGSQVYELLLRVAATRPEEPQTYLALAGLADELGADDLALVYYELALVGGWDGRFGDYGEIAAVDYMRFLKTNRIDALADPQLARARLEQLRSQLPIEEAGLLVVMTWNTDSTDIDLHVREPSGTEVFYSHPNSLAGGHLTRDVTTGYGPEMYYIPRMRRGTYDIRAHYFASNRNRLSTRTKVYVTIFRDFGTAQEQVSRKVVTLEDGKDVHPIAKISGR
jgi:hypothetical protein